MKFNKSGKDNIIKMTNQEATHLINILGDLLIDTKTPVNKQDAMIFDFMDGLQNLKDIGTKLAKL